MHLFLLVKLVENSLDLVPEKHEVPEGYTLFDLDNFSEDVVIATAIRAIAESKIIHLEIHAIEGAKLGAVLKIMNKLIKFEGQFTLGFKGHHTQIEKMLKRLPTSQ